MRFPSTLALPEELRILVNDWMVKINKEYDFTGTEYLEEDVSGMSSLSITVTGSGLGDTYKFSYKTFEATGFLDDDGYVCFKKG